MKSGEKAAVVLFGVIAIGSAILLLFPFAYEGEATRGISGAFNLPLWVLFAAGVIVPGAYVLLMFVNVRRRRKGSSPL